MAPSHHHLVLVILLQVLLIVGTGGRVEGAWCVAKSNVSPTQLQTALDYACGAGADCAPITSSGLCFLPNTIQAHASYAFNSYYQRKSNAPGSCDFSSSATIATTDPSYGSCVYPPNPRYYFRLLDPFFLFSFVSNMFP
ncbi:hypothetical protein AQUCO_03400008v1 [Aquilegia coerulea]|uniref:X8 domain-containing protein n=1 Tax=Aquilegia coerulea TaxID=218851 RepID=A0A2G5CX34_AQUCA|nr:hypothetical protein AQUCO_03400008v1 [Aquilegia coerulea]